MRLGRQLPHLLTGLAVLLAATGTMAALSAGQHSAPRRIEPSPTPHAGVASRPAAPVVAPLTRRIPAHLLVLTTAPLPPAVLRRLMARTGATAKLVVASGEVRLGSGRTTGLGVDPSTFRAWTPRGTADSDALWRSVAVGEGSVAHVVARAFGVTLGGSVIAAAVHPVHLRVGSFATTGLPGIGLVVDATRGRELALRPGTGLLLSVPNGTPELAAAGARAVVGRLGMVTPVQVNRTVVAGHWVVPTTGRLTSPFGPRVAPRPGASSFHEGIDIGAAIGTPIYAMSDGVVLYAGPAAGYGSEVVLSHRGGVTTVYGHVSRILIAAGHVSVGQPIALVGNEGESTGPHLHVEVRIDDRPVDPVRWLAEHGAALG